MIGLNPQESKFSVDPQVLIGVLNERLVALQQENVQLLAIVKQFVQDNEELAARLADSEKVEQE